MNGDLDSLLLVQGLCNAYEKNLSELDENAPEMIRVLRAIVAGGKVILHNQSPVAQLLLSLFSDNQILWCHVTLDSLPLE